MAETRDGSERDRKAVQISMDAVEHRDSGSAHCLVSAVLSHGLFLAGGLERQIVGAFLPYLGGTNVTFFYTT